MIKHPFLFFSFSIIFFGSIRSFAQQNVVGAGGNATGAGGSVSYSIGQIDYNYQSGSNGNINQGLQQPYEIFTSGINDAAIQLGLSVYPNPSTHVIYLTIEKDDLKDLSFELSDINGQQLISKPVVTNTTEISMELYAASTYFLKIIQANKELTTFKIIKK